MRTTKTALHAEELCCKRIKLHIQARIRMRKVWGMFNPYFWFFAVFALLITPVTAHTGLRFERELY